MKTRKPTVQMASEVIWVSAMLLVTTGLGPDYMAEQKRAGTRTRPGPDRAPDSGRYFFGAAAGAPAAGGASRVLTFAGFTVPFACVKFQLLDFIFAL